MTALLADWFWPNPAGWTYGTPKVVVLLTVSIGLIVLSFVLRMWRKRLTNPMTKTLSRSWPGASLWFGIVGLFLTVSRVEQIQFVSMQILWIFWLLAFIAYVTLQLLIFRRRHYTAVRTGEAPGQNAEYARYLPKRK